MKFWLYDDRTGWGRTLLSLALPRGHEARLFREPEQVDGGDAAFVRMHLDPKTREHDKHTVAAMQGRIKTVPDARSAMLYDDKVEQAAELAKWMPRTIVARSPEKAREAAATLGLPLMSKTAEGSASKNVRFIQTENELSREIGQAFGQGIVGQYGVRQQGYVLFQEFCPGNDYDFRVIAIGRERLILRRGNRDDAPMASGSDREMPVTFPDAEAEEVLAFADRFFAEEGFTFCGVDVVRHGDRWVLVEMTTSWPTKLMHVHRFVSGRPGSEYWNIVMDELEAGSLA
jgi:glutathione synthase/RimK-type ligase-like ATP-grasp enzyme